MIGRTAVAEGNDWDKLIPYLLFDYREVPQAFTGFSPFELLYCQSVQGPLDVVRDLGSLVVVAQRVLCLTSCQYKRSWRR